MSPNPTDIGLSLAYAYLLKISNYEQKLIKEIVIYRSQEGQLEIFIEQGLPQLQGMASQFDGIKSHLTFQSTKEPELFLDIVEWESLEQAERAAQMMEEQMKKADPTAQIAGFGKTDFFNHFKLIS